MNFSHQYGMLLRQALKGAVETNARTGRRIAVVPGGAMLKIDLSDGLLPSCGLRRTRPSIAAAENAWCLSGANHIDWLRRYTKVWDQFAEAVECANCEGTIGDMTCVQCEGEGKNYWLNEAYGNRWLNWFGFDQLETALDRLHTDPSDRRVWISSWSPFDDLPDNRQKTVPCPVGFTLTVLEGQLQSALTIRSSDLFFGLPYDVMRHALLMSAVAASLDVMWGTLTVFLAHPHIYEPQWGMCELMADRFPVEPPVPLPQSTISQINDNPDKYVTDFTRVCSEYNWPQYDPKSEVVA